MKKDIKRLRSRVQGRGLTVTKEGRYWFRVKMKENKDEKFKEAAALPLDIMMSYTILDVKK